MKKQKIFTIAFSFLLCMGIFLPNSFSQCPEFNSCYELVESDGCTHTFIISISGDNVFSNTNTPLLIQSFTFNFGINGSQDGTIISSGFVDPNGFLATNTDINVSHTNSSVNVNSGNDDVDAFQLVGGHFFFTVQGNVNSCFDVRRSGINAIFTNGLGVCFVTGECEETEVCSEGTEVSGNVTAPAFTYDCNNTENHGIEGAEITITGPNGETCITTTNSDGSYSCTSCEAGPHEVCVTTTCDEPCGATSFDLLLLRRYILGIDLWNFEAQIIGDVNLSGGASTLDLVLIQRQILGLENSIDNWCRFIPAGDYGGNISQIDNCLTTGEFNDGGNDFLRYMLGDMDGSCSDCIHGDEMGGVKIVFDKDEKSNSLSINSHATDYLYTFALKMEIPDGLKVTKINSNLPGLEFNISNGILQIIWIDTDENNSGYLVERGQSLFEILTEGKGNLKLSESDNYWQGKETGSLKIEKRIEKRNDDSLESQDLLINQSSMLKISEIQGNGTIEIYNTAGMLINKTNVDRTTSTLDFDVQAGIYILYIKDEAGSQTKKVFIN